MRRVGQITAFFAAVAAFVPLEAQTIERIEENFVLGIEAENEVAHVIALFEDGLSGLRSDARVRSCRQMVDVTQGRANTNHSYGAVCDLDFPKGTTTSLLCADEMMGHFSVKTGVFAESRKVVALFTSQNCAGG